MDEHLLEKGHNKTRKMHRIVQGKPNITYCKFACSQTVSTYNDFNQISPNPANRVQKEAFYILNEGCFKVGTIMCVL